MPKKAKRMPADPKAIFEQGLNTGASAIYLMKASEINRRRDFVVGAMMLGPFSCELLFKCLLRLQGATRLDTHYLDLLFRPLKPDIKSKIKARWDTEARPQVEKFIAGLAAAGVLGKPGGPEIHLELEAALYHNRNIFERVRYMYEYKMSGDALMPLIPVLVRVILEIKPEWASLAAASGFPQP